MDELKEKSSQGLIAYFSRAKLITKTKIRHSDIVDSLSLIRQLQSRKRIGRLAQAGAQTSVLRKDNPVML